MFTQQDRELLALNKKQQYAEEKRNWDRDFFNLIANPDLVDIDSFKHRSRYKKEPKMLIFIAKVKILASKLEVGKDYARTEIEAILAKEGLHSERLGQILNKVFITSRSADCKRYYILEKRTN